MQQGEALNWGIIGAGVRAGDAAQRQRLAAQDFLTTLIELDPKGRSAEVVGSMVGFVPVQDTSASPPERSNFLASASVGANTITFAPNALIASTLPLGGIPPASTT